MGQRNTAGRPDRDAGATEPRAWASKANRRMRLEGSREGGTARTAKAAPAGGNLLRDGKRRETERSRAYALDRV